MPVPGFDIDEPAVDRSAPEDDLRASLEAAMSQSESAVEGSSEGQNETVTEGTESESRARDEAGRFAAKDKEVERKDAAPSQELSSQDEQAKASQEQASTPAETPPVSWTAEAKQSWSAIPPAVQQAVLKREREASDGFRQKSEEIRRYQDVLSPVAREAQSMGMSVDQGINALLSAHNQLKADPVNAILGLMRSAGVTVQHLAGTVSDDGQRVEPPRPDFRALVNQAVQQQIAPLQQRYEADERQRQGRVESLISEFASDPANAHFNELEGDIMHEISLIRTRDPMMPPDKVLREAYDRAVYANPNTRSSVLQAREQATEARRQSEAKDRAVKARSAAISITGSPNGYAGSERVPERSLRDELVAQFNGG